MGLKKYVMVHHGSVRAAGLVVFRCRAQAAGPDTAEWLLLQAWDRQDNTAQETGAETVTMCPPQAPALDPARLMEEPRTAALRETLEEAGLGEGQLTVHWDIRQELRWGSGYISVLRCSAAGMRGGGGPSW